MLVGKGISDESVYLEEQIEGYSKQIVARPRVSGKFIFGNREKLYLRGVTYGTFRPGEDGTEYLNQDIVDRDFGQMAANCLNAVRTYTVPPRWLLDLALRHGLYVMVGVPWVQHVTFLDDPARARSIEEAVRDCVRSCADHPAVLGYALGNEIPAPIVRWHGARQIERFLERLYRAAKDEDPEALVTYVNYPSTEYLQLPFLDFVCFNVYLEERERLEAYLARLHNLSGDRPLVIAEIGLDSRRHGEDTQADSLGWQVRTVFSSGCAGAFVFAWTDEWYRGGFDVEDWDFGLTTRDRRPKPALGAVRAAFAETPLPVDAAWPSVSVVVCSYNGSRTIADCLQGLQQLAYPNFDVIVVDDGSTDGTGAIAGVYGVRVIRTENRGLSHARNVGLEAATGEIVAYIDDDARPDPHWLSYLVTSLLNGNDAGVGGPNLAPQGDGPIADCVAHAPGGPVHVLLSDREAEHIPGCNMAYRRSALQAIGGFDPQFRVAGDDVDLCWRIQDRGWTIGFSPVAMVWHHRRNSVRTYWKQQKGYGRAEALLERKWPQKYNAVGHLRWTGRLYGNGPTQALRIRGGRIFHGTWGSAPFQSMYQPAAGTLRSMPLMPEWYLLVAALAGISALGVFWRPLLLGLPFLTLAVAASVMQALVSAHRTHFSHAPRSTAELLKLRLLTASLHLLQPLARLWGRLQHGLTPWRQRGQEGFVLPRPRTVSVWSEVRQEPEAWLHEVETRLHNAGAVVLRGGDFDRWDLEIRGGALGAARLRMAIEEHGAGKQLIRFRVWPRWPAAGSVSSLAIALLAIATVPMGAWVPSALFGLYVALLLLALWGSGSAEHSAGDVLRRMDAGGRGDAPDPALEWKKEEAAAG